MRHPVAVKPSGRCCSSVTLSFLFPSAPPPQFIGAEFGDDNDDDKASASESSSRLSCVDRAERNSRALSLHNSITKSRCLVYPFCLPAVNLKIQNNSACVVLLSRLRQQRPKLESIETRAETLNIKEKQQQNRKKEKRTSIFFSSLFLNQRATSLLSYASLINFIQHFTALPLLF